MLSSATWATLGDQAHHSDGGAPAETPACGGEERRLRQRRHRGFARKVGGKFGANGPRFIKVLLELAGEGLAPSYVESFAPELLENEHLFNHDGLDPADGGLEPDRAQRKRLQVSNLCASFARVYAKLRSARPFGTRLLVVEFCASSGYVALPLARMYPELDFVLVDMNDRSVEIAQERTSSSGLANVSIVHGLIQELPSKFQVFDVGIGLHACGVVTDLIMERCIAAGAAFILCPCCVGKVAAGSKKDRGAELCSKCGSSELSSDSEMSCPAEWAMERSVGRPLRPHTPTAPRSQMYKGLLSVDRYYCLAKAADVPVTLNRRKQQRSGRESGPRSKAANEGNAAGSHDSEIERVLCNKNRTDRKPLEIHTSKTQQRKPRFGPTMLQCRRLAKAYIEHDRLCRAREAGYLTEMRVLMPHHCTVKNDLLVGWPAVWSPCVTSDIPADHGEGDIKSCPVGAAEQTLPMKLDLIVDGLIPFFVNC